MSSLFKDLYNPEFYEKLSNILMQTLARFDANAFTRLIFSDQFDGYELKQRMSHTAQVLHQFMPSEFEHASLKLIEIVENLQAAGISEGSVEFMFLPQYIELFGIDDFDHSMTAFEQVTQFTSAEFAVRPFLIKYPQAMLQQMQAWTKHQHPRVRRLASEGSRPRLPWAMALPSFKQDPQPLLNIINALYQDSDEVVRRSVANNLNDIAKDNTDFVLQFATTHLGENKNTDRLIKHACRTLLKQGNGEVLALFGLGSDELEVSNLVVNTPQVTIGDKLDFSFEIVNVKNESRVIRIEYGLYYLKKNGELARKVFKISERDIAVNELQRISRKQSFKVITTRVFYPGEHQLSIIINGREFSKESFMLLK
ncbi:MAG: DNA alkylation repair protein [Psychrobium sp.]|nr:DNA alkylation repair protein [Psychrobium sp.]